MESARSWIEVVARHLATVHLPPYVGALGVLIATAAAAIERRRAA